jgi:hypothetical protein
MSPPTKVDSPSPMASAFAVVEEEPLSLKRKREADEAERDPDSFIEKTLRGFEARSATNGVDASRLLARDLTSHLPFDFDPGVPPVLEGAKPLSFSVLSSGDPFNLEGGIGGGAGVAVAAETTGGLGQPFDFDFFIDSTAAGFDIDDTPADTPDLVDGATPRAAAKGEASPPSDDEHLDHQPQEESSMMYAGSAKESTTGMSTPFIGSREFGMETGPVEDYDKWFGEGLPSTFSWEGELPTGTWA